MKPLDIVQYRAKWLPGTKVNVDVGLRNKAETWCKENLEPWQWKLSRQTDWDINSYSFENYPYKIFDYFNKIFIKFNNVYIFYL